MNLVKRRIISLLVLITLICCIASNISSANERLLLFDNFSDGSLLNPPHTVTNPVWSARTWKVPQPIDDGTGNMVLRDMVAPYKGISITTNDPSNSEWRDFEAEIKFKFNTQASNFYSMKMNFYKDGETKATCGFLESPTGCYYQCHPYQTSSTKLGEDAHDAFTGDWQTLKVRVVADKIIAYLDGVKIAEHTTNGYIDCNQFNLHAEHPKTTSEYLVEIDHIKVIDITPEATAQPSVIQADGDTISTINVNWLPGGRIRIQKPGITMYNLDDEPIEDVEISPEGNATFRIRGAVAGEYPIEESLDGENWWVSQPNNKVIKLVSVADPEKSTVYIPGLQEGQRFPAAGEDYPVTIKVNVVDYDEENIGDSGRHKVSLVKTNGGPGVISSPVILDGEGEATFTITSIESGTVILEAQVVPVDEAGNPIATVEAVKIKNKLTITFDQAISPSNSKIEIVGSEPVSADGVSKQQVKVSLKDYKNQAIGGRGVIVTPQSSQWQVIVSPDEEITNEEGIAFFEIAATSSQKIAVPFFLKGRLTGEEGGQLQEVKSFEINFESPIIVGSGERESKILAERKLLASVEAYPGLINDTVPADGASYWQIAVKLFAENGNPVVGRKVSLSAGEGELLDGDIKLEQQEARTDSEGIVNYSIRTQQVLTSPLTVNLRLEIKNDQSIINHTLVFVPDEYKPVVLSTVPENGVDNAEVSAPVEIIFNEPIIATAKAKILLETDKEIFEEVYSGNESNWTVIDCKVVWRHARFQPNVQYRIEISDISDLQGNTMDPYSWTFSAEDLQPPYILTDENGVLLTSPRPDEPEVPTSCNVEIPFNEPLFIESGKPVGLTVSLYRNEVLIEVISEQDFEYIEQNGSIKVKFPLRELMTDSTYTVVASKARDLADLVMEETQWCFHTVDTKAAEILYYNPKGQVDENEFSRMLEIKFSDDVDISTGVVSLICGGTIFNLITLSYDNDNFIWQLKPEDVWVFDETYEVVLEGIKRRIANPYGDVIIKNPLSSFNWSFKIISGLPKVLEMNVLGGRMEAGLNANINVLFDRFIKKDSIPNIYILNQDTNERIEVEWEFLGEYDNLCKEIAINPNNECLFEYDCRYFVIVEDICSESGELANLSLDFQTKVEVTAPILVKADGTDKIISLEFSDSNIIVIDIPGSALSTDVQFYGSVVRRSDLKVMATRTSREQGIVAAYEIVTINNDTFVAPITIKFPFSKDETGLVNAIDNLGNEIVVPCDQLFVARWRDWNNPEGGKLGEWIPMESYVDPNNNYVIFETGNTGIFAILGYKSVKEVDLIDEVMFTQNPIMPDRDGKRSETTLKFFLAEPSVITLNIYDRNGRFIATLIDDLLLGAGYQGLSWDGRVNGALILRGLYIVQLRVRNDSKNQIHHELLSVW